MVSLRIWVDFGWLVVVFDLRRRYHPFAKKLFFLKKFVEKACRNVWKSLRKCSLADSAYGINRVCPNVSLGINFTTKSLQFQFSTLIFTSKFPFITLASFVRTIWCRCIPFSRMVVSVRTALFSGQVFECWSKSEIRNSKVGSHFCAKYNIRADFCIVNLNLFVLEENLPTTFAIKLESLKWTGSLAKLHFSKSIGYCLFRGNSQWKINTNAKYWMVIDAHRR